VLVAQRLALRSPLLLVAFCVPLLLSKSLVFYSTSGFETPLTLFLLAAFVATLLDTSGDRATRWGRLSLLAALGSTARLDNALLYAPALLAVCIVERREIRWRPLALGFAPLVGWLGFSLFYYGFAYPNTAPAKLPPDLPLAAYVREGLGYGGDLVRNDPVSALVLALGALTVVGCAARLRVDPRDALAARLTGLGVGALLYAVYVVRIGGGFLSGRFWTMPVFASLLVLCFGLPVLVRELRRETALLVCALAGTSVVLGLIALAMLRAPAQGPFHEKSVAHLALGWDLRWEPTENAVKFRRAGERHRELAAREPGSYVGVQDVIGFAGFAAGAEATLIDRYALADAFLARLPLDPHSHWRIGHLPRTIPPGYLLARRTGSVERLEPGLREYYAKLALVVSGPLLDRDRLVAIAGFNLGRYDGLLEAWRARVAAGTSGPAPLRRP
jgi:arabinofuranosyltransferase